MAEGDYEFRPKPNVLGRVELDELLRVAPPVEAYARGFTLQEVDVDRVISAARELEGAQVVADPSVAPQQAIDTLLRVIRILQSAIDVQFSENEELTADLNDLQNNEVRRLREENNRLREMRDQEEATTDVAELRRRNEDLLDQLDDLEQMVQQLRASEKEALARKDELEESLKARDQDLIKLQSRSADVQQRYDHLRDDHSDLKERYRTLSQDHNRVVAQSLAQDKKEQSEWKIENLTKNNRALEVANTELRKDLQEIKDENLQVSEKIIELNQQCQELLSKNLSLESRMKEMSSDKDNLLSIHDELRAELQDKMTLLDEFEDKFNKQYRSWEDEKAGLVAQIEALRRDGNVRRMGKDGKPVATAEPGGGGASSGAELAQLRQELNDMRNDKVLLLEAYEQLEEDVGREVDRALSRQQEEMDRLKRRVDFLQRKLEEQDDDAEDYRAIMTEMEGELKEARDRNKLYEQDVYGLPQAVEEIRQLRSDLTKAHKRMEGLVQQTNKQAGKVEDLHDENVMLRQKAGLGDKDKVDIRDIKMQKEATIAQLRALNALLERQVADLEEERRKLRMEMKFRAKYHGQHALEMGLTNEKLLLLEEYADGLKNNRVEEARVVDQMQQRINFLEVRLAEVMAYADIPPSMRPALSEFDPTGLGTFQEAVQAVVGDRPPTPTPQAPTVVAALSAIKAKEVEAVRGALSAATRRLRQMSKSLQEQRNISDSDYCRNVEAILAEVLVADKVLETLLKDPSKLVKPQDVGSDTSPQLQVRSSQARTPFSPGSSAHTPGRPAAPQSAVTSVVPLVVGDASYLADAIAEELRERLRGLAKQMAELQAEVAQKDVRISLLIDEKTSLERRIGLTMGDRKSEYVTNAEYEDAQLEVQGLKEQLVGVLEELAAREREAVDLHSASLRYHSKMQTFSDQVKLLYREYAGAQATWKLEKMTLEKKGRKAQADADAYKIATRELQTALDTLSKSRDLSQVEKEYLDTVRRMAVVQIKQAKLARELEASISGEMALTARVTELEEEVRDVSSTARGRIRWLESSGEETKRRLEQLYRELECSVPLMAYQSLVSKITRLQHEHRKLVEEHAEAVVAPGQEEVFRVRDELNDMLKRYDLAASQAAELRAKLHQAELFVKAAQEAAGAQDLAAGKMVGRPDAQSRPPPSTSQQTSGSARSAAPAAGVLDNLLGQELVAARVAEEAALRRGELVEKERDRVQYSLADLQVYGKELEKRLAQSAVELELARQTAAGLEGRLVGAKTREEVDEMVRRMHSAEAAAAAVQRDHSDLVFKAEEAERHAEAATRDRLRFLAEITNLKAALRDMSGRSDSASLIGKLHLELDHCRTKESLARNALNRSELQRLELEKTIRRQKQELANLTGRMVAHQDHAAWSERQRHEVQAQLQVSLAGRTEAWKAQLWARKLEQLKQRNEALADGLELSRKRILKLEDARQEAELQLEVKEDMASLATRSPSDLAREVARLGDQLLQLRLEKGKVVREDMLLKEKVHYTERVNAELHALLEKYEAEYFAAQSQLEADRAAAEVRAVGLQEEVERLRERINALMAARDLSDGAAGGGGGPEDGAGGVRTVGNFTEVRSGAAAGSHFRATLAERDELIALIDALKVAREEAEHLRTDRTRLQGDYDATLSELEDVRRHHQDALNRLTQQSDALLYALNQFKTKGADSTVFEQMKAVAEATINELKQRLKDRDSLTAQLRRQLEEDTARMLDRHNADRSEIERLNQKLFERNDASIQDLKSVLDRLPLKEGAGQKTPDEVMRLRDALERAQDLITVLKNRLEQKDAAIDMLKITYEEEMKQQRDLLAAARAEVEVRSVAAAAAAREEGPARVQLQKLNTQLKTKDEMLRQLRSAIKALEAKLTQVMKEHADEKMQAASWLAQERMQEQLERLTLERDNMARRLALAEDNVAAVAGMDADTEEQMATLRKRIHEEIEKRVTIERQLADVRTELQKFKNAREAVVDLTTGMSVEAKRQIEELQKRINVLVVEKQKDALKRKRLEVPSGGLGDGGGGDDLDRPRSAGGSQRPSARSRASRLAASARHRDYDAGGVDSEDQAGLGGFEDHDVEAEERRERALLQWEEGKKLNSKIDSLRKLVAAKTSEVVTLQKEVERRAVQAANVQAEADRQAAAIRELTDKLRRAQEAPRTDRAKLQEYMERCSAAEDARDALSTEVTWLRAQLKTATEAGGGGGSSTGGGPPASPGGAQLRREEDTLELRLQRDQLQLQVKRLKTQLADLGAAPPDGGVAGPSNSTRRGGSTGTQRLASVSSGREAELLSTITNLKAALERATANSTPTTKYMQEVARRKEAARDAEAARSEAERLRLQLTSSSRMVAELQSANAELRRQLQQRATTAAVGAAGPHGVGVAELGLQLSNVEMLLGQRDEEVAALRGALTQRDAELEALRGPGGSVGAGGSSSELASLRRQLRELEVENEDLRNELNAFDPSFWDEVMEMKRQHAELTRQVERYEELVVELSEQLGIPPQLQRRGEGSRSGSAGRTRARVGLADNARGSPRRGSR